MNIDPKNVLRLNLPQWQGGDRPDYRLGAQVLAAIAPEPQGPVETIAVPLSTEDVRPVDGSIVSREALLDQLTAARSAIARHQPEAIVTLGGDCLVDLAPILSERTLWRRSGGAMGRRPPGRDGTRAVPECPRACTRYAHG